MKKRNLGPWVALVCVTGVIIVFRAQGLKLYLIPSNSMEPTLKQSDYIGGFKIQPSELRRGNIVIFTTGLDKDYYVKRVIGMSGETIAIFLGTVYLDGQKLEEPYVINRGLENFGPLKIPPNQIFLMGDNRLNSLDSRQYGPISTNRVEARASFIYNPINRMGLIPQVPDFGLRRQNSEKR
jgi:signal peptidase I